MTPLSVTQATFFESIPCDSTHLFEVRAGVSIEHAKNFACQSLRVAHLMATEQVQEPNGDRAWAIEAMLGAAIACYTAAGIEQG